MGNKTDVGKNTERRRAVLYCRVATDSDESRSLELQKEKLRRFAEEQGYTVMAEVADYGSGLPFDRSGIKELFWLSHRRMIDVVLAENLSRIGRDMKTLLRIEGKLKKQHITIKTPQQEETALPNIRKFLNI